MTRWPIPRVEHVFAQQSGSMKALHQRRIGMKRNAACLMLTTSFITCCASSRSTASSSMPRRGLCPEHARVDDKHPKTSQIDYRLIEGIHATTH